MLFHEIFICRRIRYDLHYCKKVPDRFRRFFTFRFWSFIGDCPHHFFPYLSRSIDKKNPITFAFPHFARAIKSRYLDQFFSEIISIRFRKIIHPVHCVESPGKASCHFKMLFLILSHRYFTCFMYNNISSHKHGVGKQPGIDIIRLIPYLILERCRSLKLTNIRIHIKQKIQLCYFRHITLNEHSRNFRINTACEIFSKYFFNIAMQVDWLGMSSKCVIISNKKITIIFLLHFQEIPHCSEVISQMQITCRSNATDNCFHNIF